MQLHSALIDAGIPTKDFVARVLLVSLDGTPSPILNHVEDSGGGPDLLIALLPKQKQDLVDTDGLEAAADSFEEVIKAAEEGCRQIHQILIRKIKEHTKSLVIKRGIFSY